MKELSEMSRQELSTVIREAGRLLMGWPSDENGAVEIPKDEHIDAIVSYQYDQDNYARFWFLLHTLPAALMIDFEEWSSRFKLFCTYGGERYRVTGASRLGDVWLAKDFDRRQGYDKRVMYSACSDWSESP